MSLVVDNELHLKQPKILNDQLKWSFNSIFSSKISSVCPVAVKSLIYFDLGLLQVCFFKDGKIKRLIDDIFKGNENLNIEPKPTEVTNNHKFFNEKRNLYIYDLKNLFESKVSQFDLTVKHDKKVVLSNKKNFSLIKVHRYVTGV